MNILQGITQPWYLPEYPDRPIYAFVPRCYDPARPIGLFFFMHGGDAGSPPEQPLNTYLNEVSGVLQPHIADIPFITVAPAALTAIDGKRWNRKGVSDFILTVIEDVCRKFNIDRNRMILGGHSMGGFGAYHQGALLADKFAGLWLSAGAWLEEDFRGMLGTPVYIMHARWDCAFHYRGGHNEPRHHDWCGVSFARAAHELMLRDDVPHVYDEHTGGHGLDWEPSQLAFKRFLAWAALLKESGAHSYTAPGIFVHAVNPYILVHIAEAGSYPVTLPGKAAKIVSVYDNNEVIARNTDKVVLQSKGCKT